MTKYVAVDSRPTEPKAEPTFTEKWPRGSVLSYNGPSDDGERKRAVVIDHDDEAGSVLLLDGPNEITITGDVLAEAIVLASSMDRYGQRVSVKARELGRENNWCEVANDAIAELNQTPEVSDDPTRQTVNVVITTRGYARVMPTRAGQQAINADGDIATFLGNAGRRNVAYASGTELSTDYFRMQRGPNGESAGNWRAEVTFEVVDEFPEDLVPRSA